MTLTSRTLFAALFVCSACGPQTDSTADVVYGDFNDLTDEAAGLTTDSADRACSVILRHVERVPGSTGGYKTSCDRNGVCFYVWQGVVDIAKSAKQARGTTVWVQYKSTDAKTWSRKQAALSSGAPEGFVRYTFTLDSKTVGPGMSATSMQRARLDLIPYVRQSDDSRVFDHNRVSSDFDAYALTVNNQWSIAEDAGACRPEGSTRATLEFRGDFTQVQHGPLLPRGKAVIEYDLNRLPGCRGTHNGYPAWDITAYVKFEPQGTTVEQSVRGVDAPNGVPDISTLHSLPFEVTIPLGTQRMQVWFMNMGLWCRPTYDSNNGDNYWFEVGTGAPANIAWTGNAQASLSRNCQANINVPEPIVINGYIRERACSFIETEVWAPGLTDQNVERPELLLARAEATLDGKALPARWLSFVGRSGNNYRYRYELPRDDLYYSETAWQAFAYTLSFSTDGVTWVREPKRSVTRDATWCNPAWSSCD